ncbi:hypothetical protein BKA65DRAFT_547502 [Rhexocercosporidium sp. MPI-PUGE-AT-0058]|nr:hypothetical protein BKA65DRAFT_547502 [Rhexocercosporidium sp. MPI-PUGE-AT-0058]
MKPTILMARLAVALFATSPVLALSPRAAHNPRDTSIPEGYKFGHLHITGDINGVAINHTGTVQEVFAQLDAESNSFKLSDLADIQSRSGIADELDKRELTDVNCWPVKGQNWNEADGPAVIDGINYLRRGNKMCNIGAQSCGRVSCSWDAAIYLCNNNPHPISPSCRTVGDFANKLNNKCRWQYYLYQHHQVGGQAWDNDNWNVFIRKDDC